MTSTVASGPVALQPASAAPPLSGKQEFSLGWPVIIGSLICYACSVAAVSTYLNGMFVIELGKQFGWARAMISLGGTVQMTVLAAMSPVVGFVTDRIGIRIPIAFSLVGLAAAYAALGLLLNSYPGFIAMQALTAVLGAATLPVLFTSAINSWFDRARGLALGCTLVGTGVTATFGPTYVTWLIVHHGWRAGYLGIAVAILVLSPLVMWLVRPAPWSEGPSRAAATASDTRPDFQQAVRKPLFWILAATFFLQALAILGMIGHLMPLLVGKGVDRTTAAGIVGIVGLAVIGGRFFVGAAIDRIFAPWVAAAVVLVCCVGCLCLAWGGVGLAPFGAFAVGFAIGAEVDIIGFLTSRYYATGSYARLYGSLYAIFLIGAAISPLWIGAMYDANGNYRNAMLTCAGLLLAAAVILIGLPRYAAREA